MGIQISSARGLVLMVAVMAWSILACQLTSPVAIAESPAFSSRLPELLRMAETRERAVRLLIDLRFEERLLEPESSRAYRAQVRERVRLQPMAQDDQQLLVAALARALPGAGQPDWGGVRSIVQLGQYYRIDDEDFVDLLRQLLLFPRGDKISDAHGQSLMLALQAAGRAGTPSAMSLLEEATSLVLWESAGPVRSARVSTDASQAVQTLRLRAIRVMGLMDGNLARPVLNSIRDTYDEERSLTGLPQSESRFEHWAAPIAEEALASITLRESQVELRSAEPMLARSESERLQLLRREGEGRVDAAFERLLSRVFSPEVSTTIESEIVQEVYAERTEPMPPEEQAFIVGLLQNEAAKDAPDWMLVWESLRTMVYGEASEDGDFAGILRQLLEHPREGQMTEEHVKSLMAALTAAGYNGAPAAVDLLRDATTREFWTASGLPQYPDSMVPGQLRDEFSGVDLLMEHAVKAMAHAPPQLVRDILVEIQDAHSSHFAAASDVVAVGISDFDALATKAASASLHRLALRDGAPPSPDTGLVQPLGRPQ